MTISAVILTNNEERKISKCLKSLTWCDEILVIDDYSRDKTIEIAKQMGAKVLVHHLAGDFNTQRNLGLSHTSGDWILFIDADEIVTPELQSEIKKYINFPWLNGCFIKRRDKFMGQWLKHGESADNRFLRLGRRGTGRWQYKVHEIWQVREPTITLANPLLHDGETNINQFIQKIDYYSSLRASELAGKRKKGSMWQIIIYPLAKFIQNYLFRLGFLDGLPGLSLAFFMSLHSLLVRLKLVLGEVEK